VIEHESHPDARMQGVIERFAFMRGGAGRHGVFDEISELAELEG
jgi:hypothetical protein